MTHFAWWIWDLDNQILRHRGDKRSLRAAPRIALLAFPPDRSEAHVIFLFRTIGGRVTRDGKTREGGASEKGRANYAWLRQSPEPAKYYLSSNL